MNVYVLYAIATGDYVPSRFMGVYDSVEVAKNCLAQYLSVNHEESMKYELYKYPVNEFRFKLGYLECVDITPTNQEQHNDDQEKYYPIWAATERFIRD